MLYWMEQKIELGRCGAYPGSCTMPWVKNNTDLPLSDGTLLGGGAVISLSNNLDNNLLG